MPLTTGRYAEFTPTSGRDALRHRLFWLRRNLIRRLPRRRDNGAGYTLRREWGAWTIRPNAGIRSLAWITLPLHATRRVPGHDREAAIGWNIAVLGL